MFRKVEDLKGIFECKSSENSSDLAVGDALVRVPVAWRRCYALPNQFDR